MTGTLQCQRKLKPLNVVDLKRFLGITILIGITRIPSRHLYWSICRDSILSTGKAALSFNLYTQVKCYLHVSVPTPLPRKERWHKPVDTPSEAQQRAVLPKHTPRSGREYGRMLCAQHAYCPDPKQADPVWS